MKIGSRYSLLAVILISFSILVSSCSSFYYNSGDLNRTYSMESFEGKSLNVARQIIRNFSENLKIYEVSSLSKQKYNKEDRLIICDQYPKKGVNVSASSDIMFVYATNNKECEEYKIKREKTDRGLTEFTAQFYCEIVLNKASSDLISQWNSGTRISKISEDPMNGKFWEFYVDVDDPRGKLSGTTKCRVNGTESKPSVFDFDVYFS